MVSLQIDNRSCSFELETSAEKLSISKKDFFELWPNAKLHKRNIKFHTASGETIHPCGAAEVSIKYKDQLAECTLHVVPLEADAVMGKEWLRKFKLDRAIIDLLHIDHLQADTSFSQIAKL